MRRLLAAAFVAAACNSTSPTDHVPRLGSYAFHAEFFTPGFTSPATVDGHLHVTSATPDSIAWSLIFENEFGGPRSSNGIATWALTDGYILRSAIIGRAGTWLLIPHFLPNAGSYGCFGNAVDENFHGTPMTCSFIFAGL